THPADFSLENAARKRVIPAHSRVSHVLPRHQHAPRRATDRRACIALRKPRPLLGETINIRRFDFRLSKTADITPSQVIREDENNIRPGACTRTLRGYSRASIGDPENQNHRARHEPPTK